MQWAWVIIHCLYLWQGTCTNTWATLDRYPINFPSWAVCPPLNPILPLQSRLLFLEPWKFSSFQSSWSDQGDRSAEAGFCVRSSCGFTVDMHSDTHLHLHGPSLSSAGAVRLRGAYHIQCWNGASWRSPICSLAPCRAYEWGYLDQTAKLLAQIW